MIGCTTVVAQPPPLSSADHEQIDATVKQFYALSHPDASCMFSKIDRNGHPVDSRVRNRAFREEAYTRTFKPLFSRSLFAAMHTSCVGDATATGMLDARLWDSEIDTDPSGYGNDVRLKITQPVRILQASPSRIRLRVDWAEITKPNAAYYGIGRTDLILVKESGTWLIDDAYAFGAASGAPKQFDMPIEDFDDMPGIVHLRQEPS
ncbi:hypothetical protein FAZ98_05135 [Paraburkholderia acidisoli]|uniref:DUF3828 domain-containing protein n=1 Tax=Paraburkholderia acidisoli TaxID=2571748 RepID=A0A7Z2GJC7_9BURK|nr:hypothetical protein FAZ98_05135 [Paraburkholderia acidisoli]